MCDDVDDADHKMGFEEFGVIDVQDSNLVVAEVAAVIDEIDAVAVELGSVLVVGDGDEVADFGYVGVVHGMAVASVMIHRIQDASNTYEIAVIAVIGIEEEEHAVAVGAV